MKTPWLWLIGLTMLTISPALSNPVPTKILALGDSLTAGYGLAPNDAFPPQLERQLAQRGHTVKVINGGISGDTSAGGLARLEWSLADRPAVVIIELGANDALRGLPPQQTRQNLAAIIERLLQDRVTILLAGMKAPRNLGADYYSSFDALYPALADQYSIPLYPFFLDGVAGESGLNQSDGIHPNASGVAVIVEKILPQIEMLLPQKP